MLGCINVSFLRFVCILTALAYSNLKLKAPLSCSDRLISGIRRFCHCFDNDIFKRGGDVRPKKKRKLNTYKIGRNWKKKWKEIIHFHTTITKKGIVSTSTSVRKVTGWTKCLQRILCYSKIENPTKSVINDINVCLIIKAQNY